MGKLLHKTRKAILGCALILTMFPLKVGAHAEGCVTNKLSDGFFTQTGNGNTFSSTSTGAYQAQIDITNYSSTIPLTLSNPVTVLPAGLASNKVTITYTVTLGDGTVIYEGTDAQLLTNSFSYTAALPQSFTVFVNVKVQEQSGLQTDTSQYSLSVDLFC